MYFKVSFDLRRYKNSKPIYSSDRDLKTASPKGLNIDPLVEFVSYVLPKITSSCLTES